MFALKFDPKEGAVQGAGVQITPTSVILGSDLHMANSFISRRIRYLQTPLNNDEPATKGYVDAAATAATGANNTLSNLVGPTAINQSLLPADDASIDLGSPSKRWQSIRALNVYSNGINGNSLTIANNLFAGFYNTNPDGQIGQTSTITVSGPQDFNLVTDSAASAAASTNINLLTGNTVDGDSGDIKIRAGVPTGSGTRGKISLNALTVETSSNIVPFADYGAELGTESKRFLRSRVAFSHISNGIVDNYGNVLIDTFDGALQEGRIKVQGNRIQDVGTPTAAQDAANKKYVDDKFATDAGGDFKADGSVPMTGDLNMGGQSVINTLNIRADVIRTNAGSAIIDVANRNLISPLGVIKIDWAPVDAISLNSNKISDVANPVSAQDAATKAYVDVADLELVKSAATVGFGKDLFVGKVGQELRLRSLTAGTNISIDQNSSDLVINVVDDGALAAANAETARATAAEAALSARTSALEAVVFAKYKVTLSSTDITNQYVNLPDLAIAYSIVGFVDRLAIHEGAAEDYTVSTVGGVTRITFKNDIATGGVSALVIGDSIYFKYQK